jgi:hypothetical protein
MKLDFTDGCLVVNIGLAKVILERLRFNIIHFFKQLAGKRSQNPYAFVYIHGQNGMSYFQVGNNRTKTHDKTVDLEFNHDFQFRVGKYCT